MTLEELKKAKKDRYFLNSLLQYIFDKETKQDLYYLLEGNLLLFEYYLESNNLKELDQLCDRLINPKIAVSNYQDLNYRCQRALLEYYFLKQNIEQIRTEIEILREISSLTQEYLLKYDLFRLYKLLEDYQNAHLLAIEIEDETFEFKEKSEVLSFLYKFSLDHRKYDEALKYLNKLKMLVNSQSDDNFLLHLYILEAKIFLVLKDFQSALNVLENKKIASFQNIRAELKIDSALLQIEILIELNSLNKASILESEYEEFIEKNKYRVMDYYNLCIGLYSKLNNRYSKEVFISKKENYKKKNQAEKSEEVDLSKNQVQIILPELKKEKRTSKEKEIPANQKTLEFYSNLFLEYALSLSAELSFREFMRNMCSYFELQCKKTEINLVLNRSNYNYKSQRYDLHVMHYKSERLYDKLRIIDEIKDTLYFKYKDQRRGIYLFNSLEFFDSTCIATTKSYSEKQISGIYMLPFDYLTEKYGMMTFEFKEECSEENLEVIRKFCFILASFYHQKLQLNHLIANEESKALAFERAKVILKYEEGNYLYFNQYAQELFKIEHRMNLLSFLNKFHFENLHEYQEKYYALKNKEIQFFESKISFEGRTYLEINQLIQRESKSYILSNWIDWTQLEENQRIENEKVYLDSIYQIGNLYKLETDLHGLLEEESVKFTLINFQIFNLYELSSFLGLEFRREIIRHFIEILKEIFDAESLYFYSETTILIKFLQNDTRTINKLVEESISQLELKMDEKYANYNFRFNVGYLRFPMNFNRLKIAKIYKYLDIALLKAHHNKLMNESNSEEFTKNDYIEIVREEQIIQNINEAFLHNKYDFKYSPILNLEKKTVLGYFCNLFVGNMSLNLDFIYDIFEGRNLTYNIDLYLLKQAFKNVKETFKEFKKYYKVFIKVHINTLLNPNFFVILKNLSKEYAIIPGIINLILVSSEQKLGKKENNALKKLVEHSIDYYVSDLNTFMNLSGKGFIVQNEEWLKDTPKNQFLSDFFQEQDAMVLIDPYRPELVENCFKFHYFYFIERKDEKMISFEELKNKLRK